MPLGATYEIRINKQVSDISNPGIKSFLQEKDLGDKYIYKIKITQGFPDDYDLLSIYFLIYILIEFKRISI